MLVIESANNLAVGNTKLIAEKIVMPRAGTEFSRSRLIALLRQSLESCAATIVSGRAGTGKTSLALDFARRCDRAVAWYKVDAPESDLYSFFRYLIASIQKERPSFGAQGLIPILQTSGGVEMVALAEAFIYDLVEGEKKPLLIVIEDLHLSL